MACSRLNNRSEVLEQTCVLKDNTVYLILKMHNRLNAIQWLATTLVDQVVPMMRLAMRIAGQQHTDNAC